MGRDDLVVTAARNEDRRDRRKNRDGCVSKCFLNPAGPRTHRFCEPVTATGHGLNVVREHRSQTADDDIQAVIEADIDLGPKLAVNLFASDELPRSGEKQAKEIERLSGQTESFAAELQRLASFVELKLPECQDHAAIVAI